MIQSARALTRTFLFLTTSTPAVSPSVPATSTTPLLPASSLTHSPSPPPPPPAFLALHHFTCIQHRSQGAQASSGLYIHAVRTLVFSILLQPKPRLHEQGQSRQTPSALASFHSLHLSFSPILPLSGS